MDLGPSRADVRIRDLRGWTSGPGIFASGRVDSGPSRVDVWTWDRRGTWVSGIFIIIIII